MGLKGIAKRIGNIAFRLAVCSYGCDGECWRCKALSAAPESEKKNHGEESQKPVEKEA
jgi:hypothetical protein